MTISSTTRKTTLNGNDVATSFPFAFKVFAAADLVVVTTTAGGVETTQTLNADYSVSLNADQNANPGGTVTYPLSGSPLVTGSRITILSALDELQSLDLMSGGGFHPQNIEDALDSTVILLQQHSDELARAIRVPVSDAITSTEIPSAASRANRVLGFDSSGDITTHVVGTTVYGVQHYTVAATASQTVFNLGFSYLAGVHALAVYKNGLRLRLGYDYLETSSTSITLLSGASNGDKMDFYAGQDITATADIDTSLLAYQPLGGVARNVQDKLRETVSVLDFGAVNGADITTALQNAVTYLGNNGGGTVIVPCGTYYLSATISITKSCHIVGSGMWNTTLARTTDYGDTFSFSGNSGTGTVLSNCGIRNMTISCGGLMTSGAHIHMSGVTQFVISDIYMAQGFTGFQFEAATAGYINNIYLVFTNLYGGSATNRAYMIFDFNASYSHASCGDVFVSNFNLRANIANTVIPTGIKITSGDGLWFSNGHIGNTTTYNMLVDHDSNSEIINLIFVDNVMFDACTGYGLFFTGAGTALAQDFKFNNCEFSGGSYGLTGIVFEETADYENIQFNNCTVRWYTQHGVTFQSPSLDNISFVGCNVRGNSWGNSNGYDNYAFETDVVNVSIIGGCCDAKMNETHTPYVRYGINLPAVAEGIKIVGVDLGTDYVTAPINSAGNASSAFISGCVAPGASLTVASAATIVVPRWSDFALVSGTTTVNAISVSWPGRKVTLTFDNALSVGDGVVNIMLSGPFTSASGDTLTLVCDGTNWIEVSRSRNSTTVYSEGTFTPTVQFGGAATGVTYSAQAGQYVQQGNLITFSLNLTLSSKGSSTGTFEIAGLPNAASAVTSTPLSHYATAMGATVGDTALSAYLPASSNKIRMTQQSAGSVVLLTDADCTNSTSIMISGSYRI